MQVVSTALEIGYQEDLEGHNIYHEKDRHGGACEDMSVVYVHCMLMSTRISENNLLATIKLWETSISTTTRIP